MALIVDTTKRSFISEDSFTDETQTLSVYGLGNLVPPSVIIGQGILSNTVMGMSLYGPDQFNENNLFLPFISYPVSLNNGSAIFERNWDISIYTRELRNAVVNGTALTVYIYFRGEYGGDYYVFYDTATLSLNSYAIYYLPVFTENPTYTINDSLTKNLTGNSNTIIRYVTDATIAFKAETPSSNVYGYTVRNGSKFAYQPILSSTHFLTGNATLNDVETTTFTAIVEDSYGYCSSKSITVPNIVEYFFPTCRIKAQNLSASGGSTTVTAEGIVFTGNFGASSNSVTIQCRYRTSSSNTWSSWRTMTPSKGDGENGYKGTAIITGLNYQETYIFEGRITDSITTVVSSQIYSKSVPVFDWSETDFNFNVPINVEGNVSLNGETVLRHTGSSTNNTVLSASGGHIYIRPGGTSDTTGEIKITPQGNIVLAGDITVNGVAFSTIVAALQSIGLLD